MGLLEEATEIIKDFSVDWAIEHYHSAISEKMGSYLTSHTPDTWRKLINDVKPLVLPDEFYQFMSRYRSHVKSMTSEEHAELMLEFIIESRPDLADVILKSNEDSKERAWFFRCIEIIKDRLVNPERYMEAPIAQTAISGVKCDTCGKSFIITKEDVAELKNCPFCGVPSDKSTPSPKAE